MIALEILIAPSKILTQQAKPVPIVNQYIKDLANNMIFTMHSNQGIGLAANQVGVLQRVIVIDLTEYNNNNNNNKILYPIILINPNITYQSKELTSELEGCLSIPEQKIKVDRPKTIAVEYLDINNKRQNLIVNDLLSRVICHEVDHLNGKLLLHYLSKIKQDTIIRKLVKYKKFYGYKS